MAILDSLLCRHLGVSSSRGLRLAKENVFRTRTVGVYDHSLPDRRSNYQLYLAPKQTDTVGETGLALGLIHKVED